MYANSLQISPYKLSEVSQGFNAVVDFLSQFNIGTELSEDDFAGLNQSPSSLRKSLNRLGREGVLTKIHLNYCDDCSVAVDEELICQECGKNIGHFMSSGVLDSYKVMNAIERSSDDQWPVDSGFFITKAVADYPNGSTHEFLVCLRSDEVLLHRSARLNNIYPTFFKINNECYRINSDEIFYPQFGNRIRHYSYTVFHKESKIVQNNVTNYGTIGTLNQTIEANSVTQANAALEIKALLDTVLKNLDQTAADYSKHKEGIEVAKNEQTVFSMANTALGFLSSVVTVAGYDLAGAIEKIQKLVS